MFIPRIYQSYPLQVEQIIDLTVAAAHYVIKVLRLKVGDPCIIFNGEGGQYHATIIDISKRAVKLKVDSYHPCLSESPLQIHLGQVIVRGDRMDFILQKSVELGVLHITPLLSDRCQIKLTDDRLNKRLNHWRSIIISACEQSGRDRLPQLHPPQALSSWLPKQQGQCLLLQPESSNKLMDINYQAMQCTLLVGPESGFSRDEISLALAKGFIGVNLGPRILRTETVALSAISIVQANYGDM